MRLLHLADLHLGKILHGVSLIEQGDQPAMLSAALDAASAHAVDAVLIAGDVYDRAVPPREAIALFDTFLTALHDLGIPVLVVSGNHDSGPRLHFASELLGKQGVHICGTLSAKLPQITLSDEHGLVCFTLMPYIFPAAVEEALGLADLRTYEAAAKALIEAQQIDTTQRNVLLAHQLVLAGTVSPEVGGSETMVGGVGQIDVSAFSAFDYVALGHIHKAQAMGSETVRYAGSPLCYHFSEIGTPKGALLVDLGAKGEKTSIQPIEFPSRHPLVQKKGTLAEIIREENASPTHTAFIRAVLTDASLPSGAVDTLYALFQSHNSLLLETVREYRTAISPDIPLSAAEKQESLETLFANFYSMRTADLPDGHIADLIRFAAQQIEFAHTDELDRQALAQALCKYALEQEDAQ